MRIIFLDIDGVLNSSQSAAYWYRLYKRGLNPIPGAFMRVCPIAYSNLLTILEKCPDVRIVLSSTWRIHEDYKEKLRDADVDPDVLGKIIDRTPIHLSSGRGNEINQWLENHPEVDDFIIIDDDSFDMQPYKEDKRFINTSTALGLTYFEVERIIKYFNGDNNAR